jgi:ketol-acid reductoisomerase
MKSIAERTNDALLAKKAFEQIETAYETMRSGGHDPAAEYFNVQHSEARSLFDRLSAH